MLSSCSALNFLGIFQSILEVFLLCLAGYILAGRGILDKKTQKVRLAPAQRPLRCLSRRQQLNRLNVSLFTPSLLFSKVAFFLSPGMCFAVSDERRAHSLLEKLKELWIIPIFFVIVTTVSMSVSFLLGSIFRVKRSQRYVRGVFSLAAASAALKRDSIYTRTLILSPETLPWRQPCS
jgi:predicted permease